ncbi:MAG: dimethyladenosine transferase [Marteilia pararefringens]
MVGKASRAKKIAVIQDKTIINSLVDQINAYPSDTVLFVGASSIELISRVYDNALKVIVIEEDINLVNKLQRVMITSQKQSKLKVINANFEQSIFPCFTIGVINAPFSVILWDYMQICNYIFIFSLTLSNF